MGFYLMFSIQKTDRCQTLSPILHDAADPQHPFPIHSVHNTSVEMAKQAQPGVLSKYTEKELDKLHSSQTDKIVIRDILNLRDELEVIHQRRGNPSDIISSLKNGKLYITCSEDNILNKFSNSDTHNAILARTLTRGSTEHQNNVNYTPGKVERNTLNNRLDKIDILVTPSTMLTFNCNISTISSHPGRPKWYNMPSILYTSPITPDYEFRGTIDNYKISHGNVLSFASNQGFTPEFTEKVRSNNYSHAELVNEFTQQDIIQKNIKASYPYNNITHSLNDLQEQAFSFYKHQLTLESADKSCLYPDGSVPHNEVISRLYLWDAIAVETGKDLQLGLETAFELQIARKALSIELQGNASN